MMSFLKNQEQFGCIPLLNQYQGGICNSEVLKITEGRVVTRESGTRPACRGDAKLKPRWDAHMAEVKWRQQAVL